MTKQATGVPYFVEEADAPTELLYFPSFQISAESFQSVPTFSHTTRYLR